MNRFLWGVLIGTPVGMIAADTWRSGRRVTDVAEEYAERARELARQTGQQQWPELADRARRALDSASRVAEAAQQSASREEAVKRADEGQEGKPASSSRTATGGGASFRGMESVSPTERQASAILPQRGCSLNYITREELISVYGIGPVIADRIIHNRPYERDEEVVERGVLPRSAWAALEMQLRKRTA